MIPGKCRKRPKRGKKSGTKLRAEKPPGKGGFFVGFCLRILEKDKKLNCKKEKFWKQ